MNTTEKIQNVFTRLGYDLEEDNEAAEAVDRIVAICKHEVRSAVALQLRADQRKVDNKLYGKYESLELNPYYESEKISNHK